MVTLHVDTLLAASGLMMSLVGLTAAAFAWSAARRARRHSQAQESATVELRRRLDESLAVQARAGRRAKRLEQEFVRLAERLGVVESRGDSRPFDQAIDSARRGATSGKLAEQYGLSRGEADLVARLHGRDKGG